MLYHVPKIDCEALLGMRMRCRELVISETRHLQAARRLLKLQRATGFSLLELKCAWRARACICTYPRVCYVVDTHMCMHGVAKHVAGATVTAHPPDHPPDHPLSQAHGTAVWAQSPFQLGCSHSTATSHVRLRRFCMRSTWAHAAVEASACLKPHSKLLACER